MGALSGNNKRLPTLQFGHKFHLYVSNFTFVFRENWKIQKCPFKINWPLADLITKKFLNQTKKNYLFQKTAQNLHPKKYLPRNSSKKRSYQKIPKQFPPKMQKKKFPRFWKYIQFPISHLKAENPIGLVLLEFLKIY